MADLITYVPDLAAMNTEGAGVAVAMVENEETGKQEPHPLSTLFSVDDDGALTFNVTKIPVTYSDDGNKSLCLVRGVKRSLFEGVSSIQVLGEVQGNQYVFDSADAQTTYETVYDVRTRTIKDEDGNEYEYTPPYQIGVFL